VSNIYDALNKEKQEGAPRPVTSEPIAPGARRALPPAGDRTTDRHLDRIRQRIVLDLGPDGHPVVVFTGAVPGEGTSTLSLRFAREIALADPRPVLLVDGDLARGPGTLSGVLQTADTVSGLSDLLAGAGELPRLVLGTEQTNLHFLPCGCADLPNLELVRSDRVENVLREMMRHYSFVVIDAGALLAAPETALLASPTAGVVLVVRAGRTRREVVQRAVDALSRARCRVLGVVLNDRRYPIPGFIYRRI
jgi:capsular exopolysaccharide synthesis family protein